MFISLSAVCKSQVYLWSTCLSILLNVFDTSLYSTECLTRLFTLLNVWHVCLFYCVSEWFRTAVAQCGDHSPAIWINLMLSRATTTLPAQTGETTRCHRLTTAPSLRATRSEGWVCPARCCYSDILNILTILIKRFGVCCKCFCELVAASLILCLN